MKKTTRLIVWFLILTLLSAPLTALAAERTTIKGTDTLCSIYVPDNGKLIVDGSSPAKYISYMYVSTPEDYSLSFPDGEWTIRRLSGDPIALSTELIGSDSSVTNIVLDQGTVGQFATFVASFTASALADRLTRHFSVQIVDSSASGYNDYRYAKTEHTVTAGRKLHIDSGTPLPEGATPLHEIRYNWDAEALAPLFESDRASIRSYDDGSLDVIICEPGTYRLPVVVQLYPNNQKDIVHTITVTGEPTEEELPDFEIQTTCDDPVYLYQPGEQFFNVMLYLEGAPYEKDVLTWSVQQTQGPSVVPTLEGDSENATYMDLIVRGELPIGAYTFKVTLIDSTRGEQDSLDIHLSVIEYQGAPLPEQIIYKALGEELIMKQGDVITLKAPTFLPAKAKLPKDKALYEFNAWLEGEDEDMDDRLIIENEENGRHKILGAVPGTYQLRLGLDLYDGSYLCEQLVTLIIEPRSTTMVTAIELDKPSGDDHMLSILPGEKVKVKATVLPKDAGNKLLNWTCDGDIQVSDKGVITGKEAGDVGTVYVRATDGSEVTQVIHVRVLPKSATKLVLEKKKATLKVGDTLQMNVKKFVPEDTSDSMMKVLWFSDDSEIAEVDMNTGLVLACKAGKTKIKGYAAKNGSLGWDDVINKKVFGTCVVTVKADKATGIAFTQPTLKLDVGDTEDLDDCLAFEPEGASGKVTFKSDAPAVATVDKKGVLRAVAPGQATITATLKGVKEPATLIVTVPLN
ncbi:MAG: Ig-like domain-containing protein [Clostridia bacterium]